MKRPVVSPALFCVFGFFYFLSILVFDYKSSYLNIFFENPSVVQDSEELKVPAKQEIASKRNLNLGGESGDILPIRSASEHIKLHASLEQSAVRFYTASISFLPSPANPDPMFQNYLSITLQQILDGTLAVLEHEKIPVDSLSISLIDLTSQECCVYAGFQDNKRRYPASLAKLFWMSMLKDLQNSSTLTPGLEPVMNITAEDERKMLHESDNNSASKVLDAISGTTSSKVSLPEDEFADWAKKRISINEHFYKKGYTDINLTQKTFPIPSLEIYEPTGPDLQLREVLIDAQKPPQRNYLTSFDVAKLLLDLAEGKIVSQKVSFHMKQNLFQEHSSEEIRNTPYNPIVGFFGERLPDSARVFTKIGFTESDGRQEAAIIESQDQEIKFILVVFANDPFFSREDSTALPIIANFIYSQMSLKVKAN